LCKRRPDSIGQNCESSAPRVAQILLINPRLGSGPGDAREVMAARFFTDLSWTDLERGRIPPPFKPQVAKVGREEGRFFCQCWLWKVVEGAVSALKRKSHLCIPRKGIVRPQFHFPYSCVCAIYTFPCRVGPHIFLQQDRKMFVGINKSLTDT
jgi:hypothetical protein